MQIQSVSKTGKYDGIQVSFHRLAPERSTSDMLIFKNDSLGRRLVCAWNYPGLMSYTEVEGPFFFSSFLICERSFVPATVWLLFCLLSSPPALIVCSVWVNVEHVLTLSDRVSCADTESTGTQQKNKVLVWNEWWEITVRAKKKKKKRQCNK